MAPRAPPAIRAVLSALVLVALAAAGLVAAAWLLQERLIFFPQPILSTTHLPARARAFEVTAADGTRLAGWIVPAASPKGRPEGEHRSAQREGSPMNTPAPAVLYFGGNAEEVSWTLADAHWPRGWTIVAVNYRGYGTSGGKPGERELSADALAIFDALAARADVDARRIVVFGRSLGTALAARVAAERPVAGAILASPFDSLVAVGRGHYPFLPVALLLRHRFDASAAARLARAPLLAIVAGSDSIILPERSRALYDAWAGPKSWVVVPGADHNTLGAYDAFWGAIAGYLAQR